MAETANIALVASNISDEIFKYFLWDIHPRKDENFPCHNSNHTGSGGAPKQSHPGDVVFHYSHPYTNKRIYLHTDLKSYAEDSITKASLRTAIKSLAMTVECARESEDWRKLYSVLPDEQYEVHGLLFVYNHDNKYEKEFDKVMALANPDSIGIPPNVVIHFLGPQDIKRLLSICNDIMKLQHGKKLPEKYTFYYPDLMMYRRTGDVWDKAATVESLTGPYTILRYDKEEGSGFVVYYNGKCESSEEFEYFLDCLSRYQMIESGHSILVRVTSNPDTDLKGLFALAQKRYAKAWGFDAAREKLVNAISIDSIMSVTSNFNPGEIGWRES